MEAHPLVIQLYKLPKASRDVALKQSWILGGRAGINRNLLTLAIEALKSHHALNHCVQSEITAQTDVAARMKTSPNLANKDFTGIDFLTAVTFHAPHFRVTFATVFGTTTSFFMCHDSNP
ncbi:MAG: hypothetical protein A2428_05125 [Bdellovibrionales bacterium RIFOXYC1_FULL_54_43]|nr:MAG: hypothetical protein A2428_05125 [Bdellovibrionales bacterium RIFOXYC1_FULL_54_43]OFZ79809.1 MAG: hypothetical protein A2603_08900 [Bdellovibrionales bacterium RIFOXYD1_FULL_55_31]